MSESSQSVVFEPEEPSLSSDAAVVLRQFRLVFNAVKTHFQRIEAHSGLGGAQLWALSIVVRKPGTEVGELALAMDIHQSTASNLVRALVKKGLIQTARDERDRRVVHLLPTDEGLALLAAAPGPFAGMLPDALSRLEADTLLRLKGDLSTLIVALGLDEGHRAAQTPLAEL